ncbi:SAM-dependent methyltransferase [Effusibacillus dendaii]|uniref:Ribosomal RNA methyltransferase FtsJ domain-containing protein n=1 Tax=Effusibacillus dendaii TaxID=2743772 RepID=A0A7I8D7S9_9BACL|nr:SAM-dependent methyltransferase [Effusibacillus dendaii]BCJ86198.1 hypothetical protein skT53_11830 [Effusibacillus dendaii]
MQEIIATSSPGYEVYAFDELKKIDSTLTGRNGLQPGVFLIKSNLPFSLFSETIQRSKPIFTRHIQPVDLQIDIDRSKDDFLKLIQAVKDQMNRIPPTSKVAVQVRRHPGVNYGYTKYGMKEALDPILTENGYSPSIQQPDFVISILMGEHIAYFGISQAQENLSDWPGGAIRFQRQENQLSRSRFKLEEACLTFGIPIHTFKNALDLGASPGGWTSFLLDQGLHVTAVDTSLLDSSLMDHPHLTFVRENASDTDFPANSFDILTCDMSWSPQNTAKILVKLEPSLQKNGIVILTIKLLQKKIRKTIQEVLKLLQPAYETLQVKQLFHNRDEVTAYLKSRKT